MKTPQNKNARQAAVYIFCYENGLRHPKGFYWIKHWWNILKSSPAYGFPDPLGKEKYPAVLWFQTRLKKSFPNASKSFIGNYVRVNTNKALFQEIIDAMIEKLREEGELRG